MFKKITLLAALLVFASSAYAADSTPGVYLGLDAGQTRFSHAGDDNSFGVFGGVQANDNFALEVGYRRLGEVSYYIPVTTTQAAVSLISSVQFASGFSAFARIGYNQLNASASYNGKSGSADASGALYGIGLGYAFTPAVSLRVELQRPSSDSTNLSAGLSFKFK